MLSLNLLLESGARGLNGLLVDAFGDGLVMTEVRGHQRLHEIFIIGRCLVGARNHSGFKGPDETRWSRRTSHVRNAEVSNFYVLYIAARCFCVSSMSPPYQPTPLLPFLIAG